MATWPDIPLPSSVGESSEDPAIRSEFESGIVQTRPRYTRVRRTWQLGWDYMEGKDYAILWDFYLQMRGGSLSFTWAHPTTSQQHTVRFREDIRRDSKSADFWSVSAKLEEV